ncbi:hypothetical protein PENSPDRAFT_756508 [Peniophora sp. CONT]|nr:hypothetical protein PENSPDRAFT_756508 [Peniophora sp. CONT]
MHTRSNKTSDAQESSPSRRKSPTVTKREHSEDEPNLAESRPPKRTRTNASADRAGEEGDVTLVEEDDARGAHAGRTISRSVTPVEGGPKRSERFWYEDGSVVLQVGRTLFRLHKTLLSAQSSYFRDLFSDPYRPAEDYDAEAGATYPLYVLSVEGLRAFDVEQLLETMENPLTITRNKQQVTLNLLGAVARAAHILKFEGTHAWAAEELGNFWPTDLSRISPQAENCADDAIAALQLSTDSDIPGIRKSAFYELLRLPEFGQDEENVSPLRHADYKTLTHARQYCMTIWMQVMTQPPSRSGGCKKDDQGASGKKSTCAARSRSLRYPKWFSIIEKEDLRKYWVDPIAGYDALLALDLPDEDKGGFCIDCTLYWEEKWDEKKEQFWTKLDEVLGLAPV